MSRKTSAAYRRRNEKNPRPTLFDQIGQDMRKNPYSFPRRGSGSIWFWIIPAALLIFWMMINYH